MKKLVLISAMSLFSISGFAFTNEPTCSYNGEQYESGLCLETGGGMSGAAGSMTCTHPGQVGGSQWTTSDSGCPPIAGIDKRVISKKMKR